MPESRPLIESAIEFAVRAHRGQRRKGSSVAYAWHPLAVGRLLQEAGYGDEVVAAGLLHDTLEDTSATREQLRGRFGERVAGWVEACTEPDRSIGWERRKESYLHHLKEGGKEVRGISAADKIDNLRLLASDLDREGEVTFEKFNRGRVKQEWFFRSVAEILRVGESDASLSWLLEILDRQIRRVFGEPPSPRGFPR